MSRDFQNIELRVPHDRFKSWDHFIESTPEFSIGVEVVDDIPGHRGHHVHFDHHVGVVREATMSAALQAFIAVRQGRLMERWLKKRSPVPVYVWNADQDVCLAAFLLENHHLLEGRQVPPELWNIVQFNNLLDVCGGLFPVDLADLERSHHIWVFEPYMRQRRQGKSPGDEHLIRDVIGEVCERLTMLIEGRSEASVITACPQILHVSPHQFVISDDKGDPNARLVLAAQGYSNFISLIATRPNGRYTYSVIRGSPYDDDIFPVPRLLEAFQEAEKMPGTRIWGGSNTVGGCDSELGSGLHWTELRDIAEGIAAEWRRKNEAIERAEALAPAAIR